MIINYGNKTLEVIAEDDSYRTRQIMGDDLITLNFSLPYFIEIPIGAYVEYEGIHYALKSAEDITKNGTRNIKYTLTLRTDQYNLSKYKLIHPVSRKIKFSMMATPAELLRLIVENMNMRETGWAVGESLEATQKLITFEHVFISEALAMIAEEFETEWEINGKTVHLRKIEHNIDAPLPLSYGNGNGLLPGVRRTEFSDTRNIEILYVQGGERNIDSTKYGGATSLLLPKSQELTFNGVTYETDPNGYYIKRKDKPPVTGNEDSIDLSNIYPSRDGEVTGVVEANAAEHFYDVIDATIPESLNFNSYLINGETTTLMFQTGWLAGREFEINKYVHADRRFELVPFEFEGETYPNQDFKPAAGDKYAIYGIMLPEDYVCNNTDKTGASWDMFKEAARYLYDHENVQFTYNGTLDGIWAKNYWSSLKDRIRAGGYVSFTDPQFQNDPVLIRITGVKDYLNNPHSPEIELSNSAVGGMITSRLNKIEGRETVLTENVQQNRAYSERRWRDVQEMKKAFEDALDAFQGEFTESISPITVSAMQLIIGSKQLQLRFVDSKTNPHETDHPFDMDMYNRIFSTQAGIIQHMTLGIDELKPSHDASEYKFWDLAAFSHTFAIAETGALWLYARCSKSDQTGEFLFSDKPIALEEESGYYHFAIGYLNSEYENSRSFSTLYGFTEILPGQMRINKIISTNGNFSLDMVGDKMKIGSANANLNWNIDNPNRITLVGTLVQSESGITQPLGVFRGEYDPSYTYFEGDEVTFEGSSYLFIYQMPQTGKLPTDTAYWAVTAAKGASGANGEASDWKTFVYMKSPSKPAAPAEPVPVPSGWRDYPDSEATGADKWWMSVAIVHWDGTSWVAGTFSGNTFVPGQWSEPVQVTGEQGTDGQYVDFKFYATPNLNSPAWNATLASMLNPTGWSDSPPTLPVSGAIWMIEAWKQSGGTQLLTAWSTPVRISGEKGATGQDGISPYTLDLTNENSSVPCDAAGTPLTGITWPSTTAFLYLGQTAQTTSFTWSAVGCTVTGTGNTRTVAAISADTATVTVSHAVSGLSAVWNISKVKGGANGEPATIYSIVPSVTVVKVQKNGLFVPTAISCQRYRQTGSGTPAVTTDGVMYYNTSAGSNYGYTAGSNITVGSWNWIEFRLETLSGTVLARERVPVVYDGTDGANGTNGKDADYYEYRYAVYGSTTEAPSISANDTNPAGWSTVMPSVSAGQYIWVSMAKKSASGLIVQGWSTPVRMSGADGAKGEKGESPAMVYRGIYDPAATYYGNSNRLDCVKYGSGYYIARIDAGEFSQIFPTSTSKWNQFGASFESVATQLLLADYANIGGWILKDNKLISQKGKVNGSDSNKYDNPDFVPNIILDGGNASISVTNRAKIGKFEFDDGWMSCNSDVQGAGGAIDLMGTNTRISLGHDILWSAGSYETSTAIISNRNISYGDAALKGKTIALNLVASGNNLSEPIALSALGGVLIKGGTRFIEKSMGNVEISNFNGLFMENLKYCRCFAYTVSSVNTVYLPTDAAIGNAFGSFTDGAGVADNSFITIKVINAWPSSAAIRVYPTGSTPLYQSGSSKTYVEMGAGRVCEFTYFNRAWYASYFI